MIKSEWSKSSYSEGATNCVECRAGEGTAQVRDTQYPEHGHLAVGARADMVLLEAPNPVYLAYRPGVPQVAAVWKDGELVAGRP
ncbi:DUF397 domain-containing protein [Streptomonospora algeriensis]